MRAQLLHLSGPLRGKTVVYPQPRIVVGSGSGAQVCYEGVDQVSPQHAELVLYEDACAFHLRALQGEVFVNQRQITEVVLEAQDVVEIGRGGPKFRFFTHITPGKVCKPVRRMLTDARDVGTSSGFRALTQTIRRDIIHHATPQLKVGVVVTLLAAVLVVSYVGGWLGMKDVSSQEAGKERLAVKLNQAELAKLRKKSDEFDKIRVQDKAETEKMRAELDKQAAALATIGERDAIIKKVLEAYSDGVCLLHGRYTFTVERKGKTERFVGPDGDPVEFEYVGSGFLVSKEGHVVTNRHVAQPWWHSPTAERLIKNGLKPEFISLTAVFPGKEPIAVDPTITLLSKNDADVAVLKVDVKGVPVLPLHGGDANEMRGGRLILIGYPTGMQAIMARADPKVIEEVMSIATDMTSLIVELAKRGIISPIITQGRLNEVTVGRLVYDAQTTSGGSGGPVFGASGEVIGVNFAVTRDFPGSNFGVLIEFARELLPTPEPLPTPIK